MRAPHRGPVAIAEAFEGESGVAIVDERGGGARVLPQDDKRVGVE